MDQSIYGKTDVYSKIKRKLQSEFKLHVQKRNFMLTIALKYKFCKNGGFYWKRMIHQNITVHKKELFFLNSKNNILKNVENQMF